MRGKWNSSLTVTDISLFNSAIEYQLKGLSRQKAAVLVQLVHTWPSNDGKHTVGFFTLEWQQLITGGRNSLRWRKSFGATEVWVLSAVTSRWFQLCIIRTSVAPRISEAWRDASFSCCYQLMLPRHIFWDVAMGCAVVKQSFTELEGCP